MSYGDHMDGDWPVVIDATVPAGSLVVPVDPIAGIHASIDQLERAMLAGIEDGCLEPVEMPVVHRFVPGVYAREIFMPAGTRLTSQIHKTEHFYVVLSGVVDVYIPGVGIQRLAAGHVGITIPGTRRVLNIIEDCRWITFHTITPDEESLIDVDSRVEAIGHRIIEQRQLVGGKTAAQLYLDVLSTRQIENAKQMENEGDGL